MSARLPDPVQQRQQRKENLLLASRLARGQAVAAIDEIGGNLDAVAARVARVGSWLSDPRVWAVGSAVGGVLVMVSVRRVRTFRLVRWGWLAWRAWRIAGPLWRRGSALP